MGFIKKLFSRTSKKDSKSKEKEKEISISTIPFEVVEENQIDSDNTKDRLYFLKQNCEQITETERQLEEMKVEYQAVTSYLADIQRIDLMPPSERDELSEIARKTITLARERAKYKGSTRKITDTQYKHLAQFEDSMPLEIKKMLKNETYSSTIKKDMHYLEGEKGALSYQKEEAMENQTYLKRIAIATCVLVSGLFVLFMIIQKVYETNVIIPFLLTVVMALISAIYVFTKLDSNKRELKQLDLKLNKAITLLNKVKIKYINNTSELDYTYQKYMVNSYAELNYLWEQYLKAKEEEKHYNKNTEELEYYNAKLVRMLTKFDLADPDIWIYQAIAIIDNKEMVEVRHRLNIRRQKLRERIDYNNNLRERSVNEITKYMNQKPENKAMIMELLSKYRIEL